MQRYNSPRKTKRQSACQSPVKQPVPPKSPRPSLRLSQPMSSLTPIEKKDATVKALALVVSDEVPIACCSSKKSACNLKDMHVEAFGIA